tara:strand:+ start:76 stop:399 length:324 start_codon:yes stop_codon:yes gene_type:complete
MKILLIEDLLSFFAVRTKTITRISIADIMTDDMLIEWYKIVLANKLRVDSLKGFGYFESEFSHGYIMSSRIYNKKSLMVIEYHLQQRKIDLSRNNEINILKNTVYNR